MAELSLSKIGQGAKWAVIGAIKGAGDTTESVVEAARDFLLVAVDGVSQVAVATEKAVGQIVAGAIQAASDAGEDIGVAIKSAVKGVVKGAIKIIAKKNYRERYKESTGTDPLICPRCKSEMDIWRIWHPKYGVIYDELEEMKKGKYEWMEKANTEESNGGAIQSFSKRVQLPLFGMWNGASC